MSERDDQSIDNELSGIAMAALHEHEMTVSPGETEAALGAVRSRVDAGDLGGAPPSIDLAAQRRRRSPLVMLGAAAAVVAMFALGLVAVTGGGTTNDVLVQAPVADEDSDSTTPAATEVPVSTEVAPATTMSAVTTPAETLASTTPSTVVAATTAPAEVAVNPPEADGDGSDGSGSDNAGDAAESAADSGSVGSAGAPGAQPSAVVRRCSTAGCTQLAATEDGRIVALDPQGASIRVYDAAGGELQAEIDTYEPAGDAPMLLVAVGPDDVAYVQVFALESGESQSTLHAIALVGAAAGRIVMTWTGLDGFGDSTLVARKGGLTVVACCGARVPRPARDAAIFGWVDRNGNPIESSAPSFDLNLGDAGSSLTRIDAGETGEAVYTRFPLPTALQAPRDFPRVIATDDGGALASDVAAGGSYEVLVDFSPLPVGGGLDNGDVYYRRADDPLRVELLESSGTVLVARADGQGFERRTLGEIATPGWPGRVETDLQAGTTSVPGLNEHIDAEQPLWAADPTLFAWQIESSIEPNELVSVTDDGAPSPTITITTSGFLDDSVEGVQRVITTERGDDGLLRFVSGTYGWRCQPGRGHQDYTTEPCI